MPARPASRRPPSPLNNASGTRSALRSIPRPASPAARSAAGRPRPTTSPPGRRDLHGHLQCRQHARRLQRPCDLLRAGRQPVAVGLQSAGHAHGGGDGERLLRQRRVDQQRRLAVEHQRQLERRQRGGRAGRPRAPSAATGTPIRRPSAVPVRSPPSASAARTPSLNALSFSNSSYTLSGGSLTLNGASGTASVTVSGGTQSINTPVDACHQRQPGGQRRGAAAELGGQRLGGIDQDGQRHGGPGRGRGLHRPDHGARRLPRAARRQPVDALVAASGGSLQVNTTLH